MAQTVEYRWSGKVMEPSDGPAYLGRNPMDDKNVYIITGDPGNGMTHTTIGTMIVMDMTLPAIIHGHRFMTLRVSAQETAAGDGATVPCSPCCLVRV